MKNRLPVKGLPVMEGLTVKESLLHVEPESQREIDS